MVIFWRQQLDQKCLETLYVFAFPKYCKLPIASSLDFSIDLLRRFVRTIRALNFFLIRYVWNSPLFLSFLVRRNKVCGTFPLKQLHLDVIVSIVFTVYSHAVLARIVGQKQHILELMLHFSDYVIRKFRQAVLGLLWLVQLI